MIPTADKVRLIELLGATGLKRIEVTSFVRPDVIPQLADAAEVLEAVRLPATVSVSVLIPNERGLERALAHRARFQEINGFLSASETHNQKNVGRSIAESLTGCERMFARAPDRGPALRGRDLDLVRLPVRGTCSARAGAVDRARLVGGGCAEIGFGDTTGMANPLQVREFFEAAAASCPDVELTAHFHNTRGQGLANVLAALEAGVESFESTFGELGGCPVPAGRHRQHRDRGSGLDARRDGGATGIDLGGCSRPRARRRRCSGGRSAATCCRRARRTGHAGVRVDASRDPSGCRGRSRRPSARSRGGPERHRAKALRAGQAAGPRARRAAARSRARSSRTGCSRAGRRTGSAPRASSPASGRSRAARRRDGQRPDRQGRLVGAEDGREDPPDPGARAVAAMPLVYLVDSAGRADQRAGPDVPRAGATRAGSSSTRCASRASCRRSACCSAPAPPAAPTSRRSATS